MMPLLFPIQLAQEEAWRFVGVGSAVVGLICYALSSSFNHLFGDWSSLKIFLYSAFSSIISLAILFPKVWQHLRIFQYRTQVPYLVWTSTTVYSFFLDKAAKGKPDAYSLISCVAFAMMSLSLLRQTRHVRQIRHVSMDLMYFFMGALVVRLMEIKLFLCFVGIGFGYILIVPCSCLPVIQFQVGFEDPSLQSSEDQPQVVIEVASLQSIASSASAQNHAITQADSDTDTALDSASTRGWGSCYLWYLVEILPYKYTGFLKAFEIPTPCLILSPRFKINRKSITRILLGGVWIRQHHERFLRIFEEYQRNSWNKVLELLELDSSNESLERMIDKLSLFNVHLKNECTLQSKLLVTDEQLRDDLTTSLANILLPPYKNFIDRFQKLLGKHASEILGIESLASKAQAELKHLFRGTRAEKKKKKKLLKLE